MSNFRGALQVGQLIVFSWATHRRELANSPAQVGQLAATSWPTRFHRLGSPLFKGTPSGRF